MSDFSKEGKKEAREIPGGAEGVEPGAGNGFGPPVVKGIELGAEGAGRAAEAIRALEHGRRKGGKSWYPLSVFFCVFPAGGTIFLILAFIAPRFRVLFHDFKTEIPELTKVLFALSRVVTEDYGWIAGAVVVFLFPLMVGIYFRGEEPSARAKRYIWLGSTALALVFVLWGVVGLYVSMVNM